MKRKTLKIVLMSMFLIGILLIADELLNLHFLGDLSALDGYNPYLKHWMLGLGLTVSALIISWRHKL